MKLSAKAWSTAIFCVLKASEGGIGQQGAIELLKSNGILARRAYSPYIGLTGVKVYGSKRIIKQAERILFH